MNILLNCLFCGIAFAKANIVGYTGVYKARKSIRMKSKKRTLHVGANVMD